MSVSSAKTVFVTGASGFVGRRLTEHLITSGHRVRGGMRRLVPGPWQEQVVADLSERIPKATFDGVDTVYHLAGRAHALSANGDRDELYQRHIVEATSKVFEAAITARVRRFVYVSSVKAMGDGSTECRDEDSQCVPTTPYGRAKKAAEDVILSTQANSNLEVVIVRPAMVYGPDGKGNLQKMIAAIADRKFPPILYDGNKRSMVHVDDLCAAMMLLGQSRLAASRVFIVTDNNPYSIGDIYRAICQALGRRRPRYGLPVGVLRAAGVIGDSLSMLLSRPVPISTSVVDKLICSEWFSAQRICDVYGFHPMHTLHTTLPHIVRSMNLAPGRHSQ